MERRDETARNEKEVSVHQQPPPRGKRTAPVQNHPIDNQRRHCRRKLVGSLPWGMPTVVVYR